MTARVSPDGPTYDELRERILERAKGSIWDAYITGITSALRTVEHEHPRSAAVTTLRALLNQAREERAK